ncbi:serine hydrolase [Flammeovirga sp. EKP202]|uniref:serine hydrolase domain-containing protein n=1 Tax=Flammeovirga sp. EKP202 TaxID=2770592 RepID=UPI00165EEC2B|nr:serine hydrolase domain-containing protein [Flammeovirga sp. EKP202]MBD0401506.1 beta-lactamase family protein [Flammeovirga sp. EKP202]
MKLYLLSILSLVFLNVHAQDISLQTKIDSIVTSNMELYMIPGISIGVVSNGSILYTKGYGVKEVHTTQKIESQSVFHTASVSKLLTAQAIMLLVEEGKINLEDRLVDVISTLNYSDKRVEEIDIKSLLNHTSGLPDINNYHWQNNHQSDKALSSYIQNNKLKTKYTPNTVYKYSNLGYDILGLLIEKVSGQYFEDYIADQLLNPIQMGDSDFRYFKIKDELKVKPHTKKGNSVMVRKTYPYTREHAPSSTLNASSIDLSKWMNYFLKQLLNSDSNNIYYQMQNSSTSVYDHIGLGFQIFEIDGYKVIGHFGGDRGFRSLLLMIPEKNIGAVVLGNCDYNEDYRQEILKPILKLLLKE